MTGKERVLTALDHRLPDCCPVSFGSSICDGMTKIAKERFDAYMGYDPASVKICHNVMGMTETPVQILDWIDPDFTTVRIGSVWVEKKDVMPDGSYTEAYGCKVRPVSFYYDAIMRPLEGLITADDIKKHKWPDPYEAWRIEGLVKRAEAAVQTDKAVLLDIPALGPFEGGCWIRGFSDFLCDFYEDEYLAETLMDAITENTIGFWDAALSKIGHLVDVCGQGDDVAMQDRPFVSTEIYERVIKKYHKRIVDFIKSKSKAKVFLHVCGSAFDLLPGIIDAGVDILEAVQTSAAKMDPVTLKNEFGNELCFWGAIDTQKLIYKATAEEFEAEIYKLVEVLGKDGGLILAPNHNIQPDTPWKNLEAMFNTFVKMRRS